MDPGHPWVHSCSVLAIQDRDEFLHHLVVFISFLGGLSVRYNHQLVNSDERSWRLSSQLALALAGSHELEKGDYSSWHRIIDCGFVDQSELLSISHGSAHVKLSFQVYDNNLASFAQDAKQFIFNFYIPISTNAPHIYTTSHLHIGKVSKYNFCHFKGHLELDRVVPIDAVASGSKDCTFHIWDSLSGEHVAGPIKGHWNWELSLAFSSDGICMASIALITFGILWLVGGPYEGHMLVVFSVAISPGGKCVVWGSEDHIIHLWDVWTDQAIASGTGMFMHDSP